MVAPNLLADLGRSSEFAPHEDGDVVLESPFVRGEFGRSPQINNEAGLSRRSNVTQKRVESLAHPGDFSQPAFNRLLQNAIYWAAGLSNSE